MVDQSDADAAGDEVGASFRLEVETLSQRDVFQRGGFSRYLLDVITSIDAEQGAVVGLTGAWGSGKSWVLECARKAADERGNGATEPVLWVGFSPWQLSGTDALIEALLAQIGEAIKRKAGGTDGLDRAAALGEAFIDFAQALGTLRHVAPAIAMVNPAGGIVAGGIGFAAHAASKAAEDLKPLLHRIRERRRGEAGKGPSDLKSATQALQLARDGVKAALSEVKQKVVIVIDDLDRMAPREITDIVQMVKAVAEFPGVVYVLAYDPEVVARALRRVLLVSDGHAYLEKIIQATLDLPPPSAGALASVLNERLRGIFAGDKWTFQAGNPDDFERALTLAAPLVDSPRDVQRLALRLKIAANAVGGDICAGDLVLIEALKLKAPTVVAWVDEHTSSLMIADHLWLDEPTRSRGLTSRAAVRAPGHVPERRDWSDLRRLADARGERTGQCVWAALSFLFDQLERRTVVERAVMRPYRLQALPNWLRWRGFVAHDEWVRSKRLHDLLQSPEDVKASPFWASVDKFGEFLVLTQRYVDGRSDFDVAGLVRLISDATGRFGGLRAIKHATAGLEQATDLGRLMHYCQPAERAATIKVLINAGLLFEAGEALKVATNEDVLAAHPEVGELVGTWRTHAMAALGDATAWSASDANLFTVVQRLVQYGEPAELVRGKLEGMLQSWPDDGLAVLFGRVDPAVLTREDPLRWLPSLSFVTDLLPRAKAFAQAYSGHVAVWLALDSRTDTEVGEEGE